MTTPNSDASKDGTDNAAAAATQQDAGNQSQTQKPVTPNDGAGADDAAKAAAAANADPFADLDADTREWLGKREIKSLGDAAKLAHEQSKLLGNAIRVPGKDATEEERNAFLNKLGRPESADKYALTVPDDFPKDIPYDGKRAESFKQLSHSMGLTQDQVAAIHKWAMEGAKEDFNAASKTATDTVVQTAQAETEKLVKAWGPLTGETAKANLAFADKVLNEVGGPDVVAEFKRVNLIGPADDKIVLSAPIAMMLAKTGMALFKEDGVLKGDPTMIGNPFEDGAGFNLTKAMQVVKNNEALARTMIAAAGKTPADFGLKTS